MVPAALAALVVALSPTAADRLLSSDGAPNAHACALGPGAPLLSGARVALVVTADRAHEAVPAAERLLDAGADLTVIVDAPDAAPEAAAFALKRALAVLRGRIPDAALGISAPAARLSVLFDWDLAAYAEVVALPAVDSRAVDGTRRRAPGVGVWVSAALPSVVGDERAMSRLALTDADAVLVAPQDAGAVRWTLEVAARLNQPPAAEGSEYSEQVTVVAARRLSVAEIIARHQAHAARQRRLSAVVISTGRLRVTFEAPGFSAPVVVEAETVVYQGEGVAEVEQRRIRVNGLDFAADAVPRLPIIEPERVATPPLEIALTRAYRYRLNGRERCLAWSDPSGSSSGHCYVVAFEPRDDRRPLYRGRAWIDVTSFALVRLQAAQTALGGPIVSSEQIDEYAPHLAPGTVEAPQAPSPTPRALAWLLKRSDVRQLYEGAGHRTPIRRLLVIDRHEINPADFAARRAMAHESDVVMLRDTPEGFRYLVKDGEDWRSARGPREAPEGSAAERRRRARASGGGAPRAGKEAAPRRVVADRAARVRTLVAGVLVDPNITRPLPFAGLNYTDFDLFGTGAQLNGFFGGSYGQVAWSVPSLGGSRWQLAGSGFAVLAQYNDRSFRQGREVYAENVRQRPAHAAVALVRPLSPRAALRLGYDLDYTHLGAADTTAPDFAVPGSQWAHGARIELQAQRAGWTFAAWWNPTRRAGWRRWGRITDDYFLAHDDFQRWGGRAARAFLFSRALIGRLEAAWMGGRDLDRFSRYAFGTFDNRLRGYPSASIRYDRGAVARSALAWQAGPRLRLDAFFDAALVRDPGFGARERGYTGVGAAIETRAPFGLLAGLEWGYGIQGRNSDGTLGTHVVRVTAFKIF